VVNTVEAVKQIMLQSGASWVLWLLCALSLVSVAIIVERWLFYRARACDVQALARKLAGHLSERDFEAAIKDLSESKSVAAAIAAAGLHFADRGPAAADRAMQSAAALERGHLERGLAYLGTLGNNAPFIGLFGTVIGVIGAFEALGHAAPGHAAGSGVASAAQVASQAVMTSIAEALVATAVGILVALPAVAAFNYFQRRIAALLLATEVLSNLVLAYLSEHAAVAGGSSGARPAEVSGNASALALPSPTPG
jgi:biopolymer transport protein ExbB